MDHAEALEVLAARGPGRMVPDLDRITRLAELLGDPQLTYPSIHVTGTNGKTSTVRMIASLLTAAGLQTGTYSSPHLQTVRERFTVSGRMVSERRLAELVTDVAPLAGMVDDELAMRDAEDRVTYFEFLTAMAYWFFADEPVDVAVVEVGMGGTWDATNLLRGDVAVLTPIAVDHVQLGRTPAETATEKSGIIKPGARVVLGDQEPEVLDVVESRVAEVGATLRLDGEDHELLDRTVALGGQQIALRVGDREVRDVFLPLFGAHQAANAVTALAAVAAFLGDAFDDLDDQVIRNGFLSVTSPGRLEVVSRDPTIVVDGAHNPHGAATAAAAVAEAFAFDNLVLVVGCLDDKDVGGILAPFRDLATHVIVTRPDGPRPAATLEALSTAATAVWEGRGVAVEGVASVTEAVRLAATLVGPGDGVLVTGSLYAVGEVRDLLLPVLDEDDDVVEEPRETDEVEEEREFQRAIDEMIDRLDREGHDG